MYITPESVVHLLEGVPLDNSYTDTIFFNTNVEQYDHFIHSYTSHAATALTYQRVNKGVCRVEALADTLYGVNYMMFQNGAYGTKWFYAFVNQVNYINDVTTEIVYEIDVMQTWFFEAVLEPSYVEREHSATDGIGENLLPEPVDLGLIICERTETTDYFQSYCAVIALAEDSTALSARGWTNPIEMSDEDIVKSLSERGYGG